MDLWIRSQDKEILKQAYHIDIYEIGLIESGTQCWCIEESGTTLGKYKSKERALEILDEIENLLYTQRVVIPAHNCGFDISPYDMQQNYIYYMPEK